MLRAQPAAPAARTGVIGTVNDYWVQRRKQREAASAKRQATSKEKTLTLFK
jgi:hypothetical protein|tara:strand:- start:43 stop:195 length:153 start_codon:yes stop_codon:yes gene_type:complete